MILRLSIVFSLLICSFCSASEGTDISPKHLDNAQERQAAVEAGLLTQTWLKGHGFNILERMRILDVPGVSIAVIHNGKIDWAAGYGTRDETSGLPVTTETLFQAASISKPVSALATLRLAQEGRVDLDAPIQDLLTSFQLPESTFSSKVTPRRILNHTAGLNVHGFNGYRVGELLPTAVDILKGHGNSEPLSRIEPAGTRYRYSGGGSTMLQVALSDRIGLEFNDIMRERVLNPLGMTRSTYEQPLSESLWPNHSAAHDHSGRRITGGFHVYPEQFPAGLWTTPSDLARFVLEMQRLANSEDGKVLTKEWGQTMLTPVFGRAALGLFIAEFGGDRWFQHSGSNQGFKCDFRASFSGGNGVIVMTNGDMGIEICRDVIRAVAQVYDWPGMIGEPLQEISIPNEQLMEYAGHYAFGPDEIAFVTMDTDQLMLQQLPYPRLPLVPLGDHRFQILGTEFHITFQSTESSGTKSLSMSMAPDRLAKRMIADAYWPVQDLLIGNATKAVSLYRKEFEADPGNPIVDCDRLIQLSTGLMKFGQPEVALELCKAITEFYSDNANAWDMLGQAHSELGNQDAAREAYLACLRQIPRDASLNDVQRKELEAHTQARLR